MGSHVRHGKFGEGVVLRFEGSGPHAQVHVNFEGVGMKVLVLSYANLQVV
jgi:DNA helicase-2/ATP-dependent DNA helicase PcrA